jgi:hypothetical protein
MISLAFTPPTRWCGRPPLATPTATKISFGRGASVVAKVIES